MMKSQRTRLHFCNGLFWWLVVGFFQNPVEGNIYLWYISSMYCQLGDFILPTTLKNLQKSIVIFATFRNHWTSPFKEVFQTSLSTIFWQMCRDDMPLKAWKAIIFKSALSSATKGWPFCVMFHVGCSSPLRTELHCQTILVFWADPAWSFFAWAKPRDAMAEDGSTFTKEEKLRGPRSS